LKQADQGSGEVTIPGGVQKMCRRGTSGCGLLGMVVLGWRLDFDGLRVLFQPVILSSGGMKAAPDTLPLLCPALSVGLNLKGHAVIFAVSCLPYSVPSLSGAWVLNVCLTFFSSRFQVWPLFNQCL